MGTEKTKFDKEHVEAIGVAQGHMQKYILRKKTSSGVVEKKFYKMMGDKNLVLAFNEAMEKKKDVR